MERTTILSTFTSSPVRAMGDDEEWPEEGLSKAEWEKKVKEFPYYEEGSVKLLAKGAMGAAFKVVRKDDKSTRCLKLALSGETAWVLEEEVKVMFKLRHPHLVPVYSTGVLTHKGRVNIQKLNKTSVRYVEMELLKTDLHHMIGGEGLPTEVAAKVTGGVVSGLRYLHLKQLVHRDIKPGNIFVTAGVAKIGDFGLCCKLEHAGKMLCGTPEYLPADVWHRATPPGIRCDVWGCGCTLYEMVEAAMLFRLPPLMEEAIPALQSPKWRNYGSVLTSALRELMSTPTTRNCLEIVSNLLQLDEFENYQPKTGAQFERAKQRGYLDEEGNKKANQNQRKRRKEAKKKKAALASSSKEAPAAAAADDKDDSGSGGVISVDEDDDVKEDDVFPRRRQAGNSMEPMRTDWAGTD
eukprot:Skav217148  [mRNA]  locus=scaffold2621:8681:11690:+ [translate_table: standard]